LFVIIVLKSEANFKRIKNFSSPVHNFPTNDKTFKARYSFVKRN
jgi:hypothetical protein